jgi:serine protease Do
LTRELAESFGLSKPVGALISSVEKNGPADKAGIEA